MKTRSNGCSRRRVNIWRYQILRPCIHAFLSGIDPNRAQIDPLGLSPRAAKRPVKIPARNRRRAKIPLSQKRLRDHRFGDATINEIIRIEPGPTIFPIVTSNQIIRVIAHQSSTIARITSKCRSRSPSPHLASLQCGQGQPRAGFGRHF